MDLHVTPIGDLKPHEESRGCWCAPLVMTEDVSEGDAVIVHQPADAREFVAEHGVQ